MGLGFESLAFIIIIIILYGLMSVAFFHGYNVGGIFISDPTTLEKWLEIYRKPENWTKELEAAKTQVSKAPQTTAKAPTPHTVRISPCFIL
jgi:hypothetical protein